MAAFMSILMTAPAAAASVSMPSIRNNSDLILGMRQMLARGADMDAVRSGESALQTGKIKTGDPSYDQFVLLLSHGYLKLGRHQSAARLLEQRIESLPAGQTSELLPMLNLLGHAAIIGGRLDEADQTLKKAAAITIANFSSDSVWTLLHQARLRQRQKRISDAARLLEAAGQSEYIRDDAVLRAYVTLQRANVSRQLNKPAPAVALFREVCQPTGRSLLITMP